MKWKGRFLNKPVTRLRVERLLTYLQNRVLDGRGNPQGLTGRALGLLYQLLFYTKE